MSVCALMFHAIIIAIFRQNVTVIHEKNIDKEHTDLDELQCYKYETFKKLQVNKGKQTTHAGCA